MTEDRDKWRKYVYGVWLTLGLKTAKEQNRTGFKLSEGTDRHTVSQTRCSQYIAPMSKAK